MLWLALLGLALISVVCLIYMLYFFSVLRNRKSIANFQEVLLSCQKSDSISEHVSIIVSTYNEAKVIGRKLENIAELNYPLEKIEVLVIDDASTDGTGDIAKKKMQEQRILGRVIKNSNRIGLNRSLNVAMEEATHSLVCITDSDVILEKNALKNAVAVLKGFKGAGGVTGRIQPIFEGEGVAQTNESVYREFYDKSMLGESSLHSAFPGNGPLIVFDKSKVPFSIPVDYGSTDGNIAINIIKSGLRFIYVPNAVVLEPVPENLGQQRLQKVRRAKRLIQVFLHNMDILLNKKYGNFGRRIFPLKLLMVSVCPVLMFSGLIFVAVSVFLSQNVALYTFSLIAIFSIIMIFLFFRQLGAKLSSFVFHQVYLIVGLISSMRKSIYWKTIERK